MRREKRTTRSRSCLAWDIRAGRSSTSARAKGNDEAVALPFTRMTHADRNAPTMKGDLDFSFSGLKTAVLRHVRQRAESGVALTDAEINDICASFQRVVVNALLDRVFEAADRHGAQSVGIAGGVSANCAPAKGFRRPGRADGLSRLRAGAFALDRQRRDDRCRRPQEFPRRQAAGLDLNADATALMLTDWQRDAYSRF